MNSNLMGHRKSGGFRQLRSYQVATIVLDATVAFCDEYIERASRTRDQMVQAARSCKQNIAEGSVASRTSKEFELNLTNVARASLTELLLDYEDFLRQKGLPLWDKDSDEVQRLRRLAALEDRSVHTYASYLQSSDGETAANAMICLIHQARYLLYRQICRLEADMRGGW